MELQPLLQAMIVLGAFPAALVAILRVVPGGDLEPTLFRTEQELPWPRGVQEEEPIRYRVELVTRSGPASSRGATEPARRGSVRPVQQRA
jgi:hypothetical protein